MYSFATAVPETAGSHSPPRSHAITAGDRARLISPSRPRNIRPSLVGFPPFVRLWRVLLSLSFSPLLVFPFSPLSVSRRPRCTSPPPSPATLLTILFTCLKLTNNIHSLSLSFCPGARGYLSTRTATPLCYPESHFSTTHGWRCDRGVTLSASRAASLLRPVGRDAPLPRSPERGVIPTWEGSSPLTRHPPNSGGSDGGRED